MYSPRSILVAGGSKRRSQASPDSGPKVIFNPAPPLAVSVEEIDASLDRYTSPVTVDVVSDSASAPATPEASSAAASPAPAPRPLRSVRVATYQHSEMVEHVLRTEGFHPSLPQYHSTIFSPTARRQAMPHSIQGNDNVIAWLQGNPSIKNRR